MLLEEEQHPINSSCKRKLGQKSLQKTSQSESRGIERGLPEYVLNFTSAFSARCQHEAGRTDTSMGLQVDWEALFFTFVIMVDRQKMPWLWSHVGGGDRSETEVFGTRAEITQEMVNAKNVLLMQCKSLWKEPERSKWSVHGWRDDHVRKIIDLLQMWATWIVNGDLSDPKKAEELVSLFPVD